LKNKLGQALTVLRMYHHKVCPAHSTQPSRLATCCTLALHVQDRLPVPRDAWQAAALLLVPVRAVTRRCLQLPRCAVQVQGLDAALRALQHATPADSGDSSQQQQAQPSEPEQQQQQEGPSALQLPASLEAGKGSAAGKQQESPRKQATVQQVEPTSAGSNDTAAAVSQQEAATAQQPSPSASPAAAVMQLSSPAGRLDSCGSHATAQQQQQQQQQCLCSKLLYGGLQTHYGSNLALGLPVQQLQWALQDNSLFAEQLVSG
jgi:hypothetical protein